jgi:hypothetical protein
MYILGMVLLSLGILVLSFCGLGFAYATSFGQVVGWLVFVATVPFPMMIGGIALIRKAEGRQLPEAAPEVQNPAGDPEAELHCPEPGNPIDRLLGIMSFDLSRLNWVGWLLLLACFVLVFVQAGILVLLLGVWEKDRVLTRVLAPVILLLAVGFFFGVRWLLGKFGVTIYRH